MGLAETVAGSGVRGVQYLGSVADAQTGNVPGFCRCVSLRAGLVDLFLCSALPAIVGMMPATDLARRLRNDGPIEV